MSNPVIEISGLSKRFVLSHEGDSKYKSFREVLTEGAMFWKKNSNQGSKEEFWALNDISFNVDAGDRIGIIGRNGAGKSTLLKILSRITEPTKGEVRIRGRVASLLEVGTGFHPELTGRENIFLNGAILGMSRLEIKRKFDEIVSFAEIERFLDTPVKRYSSGMYVRLAFAVAAHLDPEILIVDEVLAVGDAQFQKKCLGKMEDVSKNEGRTVLFVSHQLGMVKSLCKKGILLEKGQVRYAGNIDNAINHYLNSYHSNLGNNVDLQLREDLPAQLLNIKLTNASGELSNEFDVFEKAYLTGEIIVRRDLSFHLGYVLERNGEIFANSFENDFDPKVLEVRKAGRYFFRVQLPGPLKAGLYNIKHVGIGSPNAGTIHDSQDVLQYSVEEMSFDPSLVSFSKDRAGIIVVTQPWELQPCEKGAFFAQEVAF